MTNLLQACEAALDNLLRWQDASQWDAQDDATVELLQTALAAHEDQPAVAAEVVPFDGGTFAVVDATTRRELCICGAYENGGMDAEAPACLSACVPDCERTCLRAYTHRQARSGRHAQAGAGRRARQIADALNATSAAFRLDSKAECRRCDRCGENEATCFAEFQQLVFGDYATETGSPVYGWWGDICPTCLQSVVRSPELIWAEAVGLADAPPVPIEGGNGWCDHEPDWSKAVIRVGSRKPSKEMRRLLKACNLRRPQITAQEALERLAVLRERSTK